MVRRNRRCGVFKVSCSTNIELFRSHMTCVDQVNSIALVAGPDADIATRLFLHGFFLAGGGAVT